MDARAVGYKIMRTQFKSKTVAKQECYLEHEGAKAQRYEGMRTRGHKSEMAQE